MSKFLRLFLPALLAMSLVTAPSMAQEADVVEEPVDGTVEPVYEDLTFYLHGVETIGEADAATLEPMTMSPEAPTSTSAKSRMVTNYLRGPNPNCSGSWLFPSWTGTVRGDIQGDLRVELNTLSHPVNEFIVEIFADAAGGCNESFVPPVAQQKVSFPAGQGKAEIIFKNVNFAVFDGFTLTVRPPVQPTAPQQARLFYDSVAQNSRVEFKCLLPEGKTTCL